MHVQVERISIRTTRPFAIARGSSETFERVVLTLQADGLTGRGEAAPTRRYDQDAASAADALARAVVRDPFDIGGTLRLNADLPPAALCALDAALHDIGARARGVPVYELLGLDRPHPVSAYTLGIAHRETTVREAERLSGYPILKMKVGSRADVETVRAVAGVSRADLWVDANEAFSPTEAAGVARELKGLGVRLIEQPTPARLGPEALKTVAEAAHPVPVVADEGAVTATDVPRLARNAGGVNVKLAKCGGIRGALRMVGVARAHGMALMLGCMVESSLGIAASAQISGLFDFVDLDGAMLLAEDPFGGLGYDNGRITVPDVPGLGVEPR